MFSRVYVEITNICNMNCSFCHGHSRKSTRMNENEFKHILEQLKGQTEYIYYHLMGEPLTHPELPTFLCMAKERGFKSVITTNGTLLNRRGDEIITAGVHKVSVSLHSFEGKNTADHERYLSEVAQFADVAAKSGVIVVLRLWNKGHDNGNNDVALKLLHSRFRGEWKENTRGYTISNKIFLEWGDRFEWPDMEAPFQSENVFCYGMKDHFGILCDGSVVPCCLDADGAVTLGNIFRENIADILSSPRARAIADGFKSRYAAEDLCRRCGYAQRFK